MSLHLTPPELWICKISLLSEGSQRFSTSARSLCGCRSPSERFSRASRALAPGPRPHLHVLHLRFGPPQGLVEDAGERHEREALAACLRLQQARQLAVGLDLSHFISKDIERGTRN